MRNIGEVGLNSIFSIFPSIVLHKYLADEIFKDVDDDQNGC